MIGKDAAGYITAYQALSVAEVSEFGAAGTRQIW
jgi:hypothetical protein